MDSSAEFASLVATHRRLMEKYEQNRCGPPNDTTSRQTNQPSNSTSEPAMRRVDGTPWIDMAHASTPRKLPYLTSEALEPRCCPRCHYSMEPKTVDVLSTPFPKTIPEPNKAMAPSFSTDGVVGINHMIQLQLASMEYARLLSALRTGSCLPPPPFYHDQHVRPYVIDPLSSNDGVASDVVFRHRRWCCVDAGRRDDSASKPQNKRKDCENETDSASTHRTIPVKRTRLVWTKELHERFVEAVEKLGLDKAVPKAILEVSRTQTAMDLPLWISALSS